MSRSSRTGAATGSIFAAGQFNRQLGNYARWRGLGSLNWELGNIDASWTARYVHGFDLGTLRPGGEVLELSVPTRGITPMSR